jgi:uncharacterized protein (DUF1800 family)
MKGGTMPKRLKFLLVSAGALLLPACGASHSSPAADGSTGVPGDAGHFSLPAGPVGTIGAARLLTQGTFGPTLDTITSVSAETYRQWFSEQVGYAPTLLTPLLASNPVPANLYQPWWTTVVNAPDQLRQRVSFALSQIFVVSEQNGALIYQNPAVTAYSDLLTTNAFINFRDLLNTVTLSPVMGVYLTYFKNQKPDPALGIHADENYAREVMQLFTVGLVMLNNDGTPQLDGSGNPIPTYGLPEIENLARVFTGWGSDPVPPDTVSTPQAWQYDYDLIDPMACYPQYHDTGAKTIIGGVAVPAGGTCESDLKIALDTLFNHPNVGPFIGQQLIQRLVTSNPSPAYVSRVAAAFNDDGSGVRGDMLAVVEAVLTDPEAITAGTAAKLREPLLRFTNLYRAFAASDSGDSNIGEYQVVQSGYVSYDEAPYDSPTVFNFFRPNYIEPGPIATANLVAPEFQITNELTEVTLSNLLEFFNYQYVDSAGDQFSGPDNSPNTIAATDVLLKTAEWEPLASDLGTLVDKVGLVFMEGAMPSAMQTTILDYLKAPGVGAGGNPVTSSSNSAAAAAALSVIDATYLVISSPQYAIQR